MAISKADIAFLEQVALLARFDDDERQRLASYLGERFYDAGQVILWEGHSHKTLHILAEGAAVVTKVVRGEVETVLTHLTPGSTFGELELIDDESASATVTAEEPCRVFTITREGLYRLFREDSDVFGKFAWAMMRDLSTKLRQTNARVREAVAWGLEAANLDPTE